MAAKCNSCNNGITNSDYITCAGVCGEQFHLKCASVTKAMFNLVTNSPNIHWYCCNCNNGNRHISAAVSRIEDSMNRLMSSLSGDLLQFLDGLKALMANLFGRIDTMNSVRNECNVADSPNVFTQPSKEKAEIFHDQENSEVVSNRKVACPDHNSSKAVVVSNIGNDVTADHLRNYLVDKLRLEKGKIHLELLLPTGRTVQDMNYLQYKITVPSEIYSSMMSSDTWPKFVRVRDFVYKRRSDVGVSLHNFAQNDGGLTDL